MEKEEVYSLIKAKLEEIGVVNHPGTKEIIEGCFEWGMKPEEASVDVENGCVVVSTKYFVSPVPTNESGVATSKRFAIIENKDDNIILKNGDYIKAYKVENGKNLGQKEYVSTVNERVINQYGIEVKWKQETHNFDGVVTKGFNVERRGIQEVYRESFNGLHSKKEIGAIELDKLESLSASYLEVSDSSQYSYAPLTAEQIEDATSKLTPAQQSYLKTLPNNGVVVRVTRSDELDGKRGR